MKIVNREQFLALPSGIVYSRYIPCITEGLFIKYETRGNDWLYQDLIEEAEYGPNEERYDVIEGSREGKPFRMDYECTSRDGAYDGDFMIYDKDDLDKLIVKLIVTRNNYPNESEGE